MLLTVDHSSNDKHIQLKVGDTTNVFGDTLLFPFTRNSLNICNKMQNEEMNHGTYHCKSNFVSNFSSYAESLSLAVKGGVNVGFVGADAEVKWCKNQTMNSNDLRLLFQADHAGKLVQNNNYMEYLKLNETAMDGIKTIDEFKDKYGSHLVIGVRYGAKAICMMTFKSTENMKSDSFQLKVWAKLQAFGYTIARFKVVDEDEKSESETIEIQQDVQFKYIPSNIKRQNKNLIKEIEQNFSALQNANKLDRNLHKLLSNISEPIELILIPIQCVRCVYNQFIQNKLSYQSTRSNLSGFTEFINVIYGTLNQLNEDLKMIKKQKQNQIVSKWERFLADTLKTIDDITKEQKIKQFMNKKK
eukprot:431065_1